jgi:hypothetical protein
MATVDEIIETIRRTVPAYARPLEGGFGQAIRTGVEQALADFLDGMEGRPRARDESGRDIYVQLGRGEVREGRSIEALLSAYRVGARIAWRRAAEAGRAAGLDSENLSLLAEAIFAYIDELSARSAAGFAEEQSAVAGEAARRRRALLAMLIQERPVDPAAIEAAAAEARLELAPTVAAVVWRDDSEQPVAGRLPLGSLAAMLEDGLACALVPDPEAPGRAAELERALGRREAVLGPAVPWPDSGRSATRARAVHRLMTDGIVPAATVLAADDHLAELIVHGDSMLLDDLATRRLYPLQGKSKSARERLLETLGAWIHHQGNVREVAEALHVHQQTVRYRLAQLRELFGDDLDDPDARFELALACRAATATRAG